MRETETRTLSAVTVVVVAAAANYNDFALPPPRRVGRMCGRGCTWRPAAPVAGDLTSVTDGTSQPRARWVFLAFVLWQPIMGPVMAPCMRRAIGVRRRSVRPRRWPARQLPLGSDRQSGRGRAHIKVVQAFFIRPMMHAMHEYLIVMMRHSKMALAYYIKCCVLYEIRCEVMRYDHTM